MTMTVRTLIELLENMPEDAEVRLATQPRWPFAHSIDNAVDVGGVVYIAERDQIGYLPPGVARELGWSDYEEDDDDDEDYPD